MLDCVISKRNGREITGEPVVKQVPLWLGGPSAQGNRTGWYHEEDIGKRDTLKDTTKVHL